MKRALGSSCAILAFTVLASTVAEAAELKVLSTDSREVVVEWTAGEIDWESVAGEERKFRRPTVAGGTYIGAPGDADVPSIVHLVAVPATGTPTIQIMEIASDKIAAPDLAPVAEDEIKVDERGTVDVRSRRTRLSSKAAASMEPGAWAELDGFTQVRGSRLARLVLHPYRYDGARAELHAAQRLVVRVDMGSGASTPPSRSRPDNPEWDETLRATVLNPEAARAYRSPETAPVTRGGQDSFASAPTWLKVKLKKSGFYQIDYFTFTNMGFNPGVIDPTTIRVFSGRFLPLAEDLNVPRDPFMTEHAMLDLGDGDTVFDTEDRLLFYAMGPTGWAAEYDSTLSRTLHLENQYSDETAVWITWGGSFTNPTARRMSTRSVVPDTTATFSTVAPHRVHFEQNNIDNYRFRDEDGWWWESLRGRGTDRRYDLKLEGVANGVGRVFARVGSLEGDILEPYRRVQLKLGQQVVADSTWRHSAQAALVDLEGVSGGNLYEGTNSVLLNVVKQETPVATDDWIQLAWFAIEYQRKLEAASGRMLHFYADSARGVSNHLLSGFQGDASSIFLFDVTDPHAPVRLQNFALTDSTPPHGIQFSDPFTNGTTRWYQATTLEGVLSLPMPQVATIRGLRTPANGGDYVVVYHPRFEKVAQRLAQIRAGDPHHPRSTKIVSVDDIYDEFSWGMVDPTAIRDMFAYGVQNWGQDAPVYAVLVGDAAYDQKGYLAGSPENLMPSYLNRYRDSTVRLSPAENTYFYSTDDFFGYLEPSDFQEFVQPGLDLAIGRYPIRDDATMDLMLDKLENYIAETQPGNWQNRVVMVADDERTLDDRVREPYHTQQVEVVAQQWIPPSLDRVKVYLTEFARNNFGKKPESQAKFIEEFTRGALLVSYTGHGDQNTMAQEEVFVSQKVPELLNEEKYPVFSTFSCTVSRFDLLSGSSMCELFLTHAGGGSVTTFSSGSLVFPNPSWILHQRWIGAMFGTPYISGTYSRQVQSIGLAALIAKVITSTDDSFKINNEKYVLLGDPALELRFGKQAIVFDPETVETQTVEGNLRVIRGSVVDAQGEVLDGTHGEPPFRGTAIVHVTENADTSGYHYEYEVFDSGGGVISYPDSIEYVLDGPVAFRGEVPVENGRFEVKFFLSDAVPSGNQARVSVFALEEGLDRDGSGAFDSLVIAPTISPDEVSDAIGPTIQIGFEGYEGFAEGDFLKTDHPVTSITLEDPSGINLRQFPQFARLEMEIDGSQRIDLANDFLYEESSYTRGTVRRIMSLAPGDHTLEVKAFDNVGNRSSTMTRFTIVLGEADFDLVDAEITPYPNPFRDDVAFVFRLTRDADVALRVFTVSGRRIFLDDAIAGRAGENVYRWDGRDEGGGLLANGTYLYKLDAAFRNTDGSLKKDEFVGRVVKMR